jgi:hypothetical protein
MTAVLVIVYIPFVAIHCTVAVSVLILITVTEAVLAVVALPAKVAPYHAYVQLSATDDVPATMFIVSTMLAVPTPAASVV